MFIAHISQFLLTVLFAKRVILSIADQNGLVKMTIFDLFLMVICYFKLQEFYFLLKGSSLFLMLLFSDG